MEIWKYGSEDVPLLCWYNSIYYYYYSRECTRISDRYTYCSVPTPCRSVERHSSQFPALCRNDNARRHKCGRKVQTRNTNAESCSFTLDVMRSLFRIARQRPAYMPRYIIIAAGTRLCVSVTQRFVFTFRAIIHTICVSICRCVHSFTSSQQKWCELPGNTKKTPQTRVHIHSHHRTRQHWMNVECVFVCLCRAFIRTCCHTHERWVCLLLVAVKHSDGFLSLFQYVRRSIENTFSCHTFFGGHLRAWGSNVSPHTLKASAGLLTQCVMIISENEFNNDEQNMCNQNKLKNAIRATHIEKYK